MGKNPFCYHAKLGGGKEFANCSPLVATRTEAGACSSIHFPSNCGGCWPRESWAICLRPFHFPVACLIVANTPPNKANEGGAVWLSALDLSDREDFLTYSPKMQSELPNHLFPKTLSPLKEQYSGTSSWSLCL